jgi:tetratricopeptide (TPR) repeat protein
VAHFTGRLDALEWLEEAAAGTLQSSRMAIVSAIAGAGGVGKTCLAVHWASNASVHFPDGELYINLHGYDPHAPVRPEDALDHFLRSLGVRPDDIPPDLDARSAMFRGLVYDRRLLILLDNASSAEQVRPLLPGSETPFVLVTSRDSLRGLATTHAASTLELDLMEEPESMDLLRAILGEDVIARDIASAQRLIQLCAGLPLAVRIVAERTALSKRPDLAQVVQELQESEDFLSDIGFGDDATDIRRVFDWSYQRLDYSEARVFRLLALHSGAQISAEAAASMVGARTSTVRRSLRRLVDLHLLRESDEGSFFFHDLLRLYAHERSLHEDARSAAQHAVRTLITWYLHGALEASQIMMEHRRLTRPRGLPTRVDPPSFQDFDDALSWCERERSNLVLAVQQAYDDDEFDLAWQLAVALRGFFNLRKHWGDWLTTHRIAVDAAERLNQPRALSAVLNGMGTVLRQLGRPSEALTYHQEALKVRRQRRDRAGQASSLDGLGTAYRDLRRYDEATKSFESSLAIRRRIGDLHGEAWSFHNLGELALDLGKVAEARDLLGAALALRERVGDEWGRGRTLDAIGAALAAAGRAEEAIATYEDAVAVRRRIGDSWGVARSLGALAELRLAAGDRDGAAAAWAEAYEILSRLGDPYAEAITARLATVSKGSTRNAS